MATASSCSGQGTLIEHGVFMRFHLRCPNDKTSSYLNIVEAGDAGCSPTVSVPTPFMRTTTSAAYDRSTPEGGACGDLEANNNAEGWSSCPGAVTGTAKQDILDNHVPGTCKQSLGGQSWATVCIAQSAYDHYCSFAM
jgi:hypothetical protein